MISQTQHNIKGISLWYLILLILAGGIAVVAPVFISTVWLVIVGMTIYGYVIRKIEWVWYGISVSPALEVWARMSKAPFVPYEVGKYYLFLSIILLLLWHIKHRSGKHVFNTGLTIIFLLMPSLIVALSVFDREQWVFNVFGITELATLLFFISRERWDVEMFCRILRAGILPIIAILFYLTFKSPGFGEMSFVLGANVDAAGGFGTNQVSTILGVGIVITALLLMLNYPLFSYKWISVILIGYLTIRGLLTFSRGGVLGAFIAITAAVIPFMFSSVRTFFKYTFLILGLGLAGWAMFGIVNNMTGDKLLQRYKGETEGTLSGNRKKTLNVATSGRADLILADIEIFTNNIFFGVGPGNAKDLRTKYGAVENSAAHTEVTRLLSEHGLGGLLVAIVFLLFPVAWILKQRMNVWRGVASGLFTLAIFTSMHSAMRTNTTVVYYVLAAMPVILNDYWLARLRKL
jgi:hypothetical protein